MPSVDEDSKIVFDPVPDPEEQKVRLVCGALFGLLVATLVWLKYEPMNVWAVVMLNVAAVVGFGLGAVAWGDQFWAVLFRVLRLFR